MKILFISNTIRSMSGASKVMRFVAQEMAKHHEVNILTILDKETLNNVPGCVINNLACDCSKKGIWRIFALKKMRKFIKNMKPDVICTFVADSCFMVRVSTLGLPIKVISCDRGDPKSDGFLWSKLSGWAYRHSDACVFQLAEVRDFFGKENLKSSFIIPNPFVPVDIELVKLEKRKKIIVSTGRFTEQKGFDILIEAFNKIYKKHLEYTLVIYGDGPLRNIFERQILNLGIKDKVKLPGFIKDVSNAIKDAEIFCLPSRYEGIPNALIEAMALGIPVVAADCSPGGAKFLTDNGKRGLLVSRENSDELAEAINYLIENKNIAMEISKKELEVRELFSPEKIAEQWKNVFKIFEK